MFDGLPPDLGVGAIPVHGGFQSSDQSSVTNSRLCLSGKAHTLRQQLLVSFARKPQLSVVAQTNLSMLSGDLNIFDRH